ncbi:class I SAM-dependent methyltransferase [Hymenobacter tibetensis]|uniref:Class I SAM-dependent methyltransferase n=1 Tax=Hymenobacter tibetensis TaxID=497967 RepID=A0ABY4CZ74_9BACT|nr:class I SAM-dependent methyltransferase [Hymenobacter tibetensis]UOG74351.1 class I SAM-dependent methyltransferase [Hymenobacter tibetensis]
MTVEDFLPLFHACTSTADLNCLLEDQQQSFILALYNLDVHSSAGLQQAQRCFAAFTSCSPYEEQQAEWKFSEPVRQAQLLFATVFERAGSFGLVTPLRSALPPKSSVALRLRAQEIFHTLLDLRTQYGEVFSEVMNLLQQAQFEGEEDYTMAVVQVAHSYLYKGRKELREHGFLVEEAAFCSLFTAPAHLDAYPFLYHSSLAALLEGTTGGSLSVQPVMAPGVLFPTSFIQNIFRQHILDPVNHDSRTRGYAAPLGYPSSAVRAQILEYGRADFTAACQTVTPTASPAERVLLYCYYNLRKHFFTTRHVLAQIIDSLPTLLTNATAQPVFLDLGCGPMTSALAFADLYRERYHKALPIRYVGIDIAPAMLEKARTFENCGLFAATSQFDYFTRWADALDSLVAHVQVNNPVIINASYLFASSSLNTSELAVFIHKLRQRCPVTKMYFLFQNPNRTDRNVKYHTWRNGLSFAYSLIQSTQVVRYQTSSYAAPSEEEVTYELLAFQPA